MVRDYKQEYKTQKARKEHAGRMERQRARRSYDKGGISRVRLESPSKNRSRNGQSKKKK